VKADTQHKNLTTSWRAVEIVKFLKNRLSGHILGVDKKYAPYLQSKCVH